MYVHWFMVEYENSMVPNRWQQEAERANLVKRLRRAGAGPALVDGQPAHIRAGFGQLAAAVARMKVAVRSWIARPPTPREQCC